MKNFLKTPVFVDPLLILLTFSLLLVSRQTYSIDNSEMIKLECEKIAKKLSSVSLQDCTNAHFSAADIVTKNKQALLYKVYPPLTKRKPQAKILLIGGIHGDEYSSISVVFKWLKKLDKHHSGLFHWKVIPLLNPDGLLQKKSQRMNANGVDLNRNFATPGWQTKSQNYWLNRVKKDPRRFPGKFALSEQETQWLASEIENFKPDAIISVHAPFGILDFDGPKKPPDKFGYLHLKLLGTYPGSLGNYASTVKGIPVITIELPYAGIMPSNHQISKIWVDLIKWLKKNIKT